MQQSVTWRDEKNLFGLPMSLSIEVCHVLG